MMLTVVSELFTTVLLLSGFPRISLRMTRWSSRSTTFMRSFVHRFGQRHSVLLVKEFAEPRRWDRQFNSCVSQPARLSQSLTSAM